MNRDELPLPGLSVRLSPPCPSPAPSPVSIATARSCPSVIAAALLGLRSRRGLPLRVRRSGVPGSSVDADDDSIASSYSSPLSVVVEPRFSRSGRSRSTFGSSSGDTGRSAGSERKLPERKLPERKLRERVAPRCRWRPPGGEPSRAFIAGGGCGLRRMAPPSGGGGGVLARDGAAGSGAAASAARVSSPPSGSAAIAGTLPRPR